MLMFKDVGVDVVDAKQKHTAHVNQELREHRDGERAKTAAATADPSCTDKSWKARSVGQTAVAHHRAAPRR